MKDHLDFENTTIQGSDGQENVMFHPPLKKRPLVNQIHMENEQYACVIHSMGTT